MSYCNGMNCQLTHRQPNYSLPLSFQLPCYHRGPCRLHRRQNHPKCPHFRRLCNCHCPHRRCLRIVAVVYIFVFVRSSTVNDNFAVVRIFSIVQIIIVMVVHIFTLVQFMTLIMIFFAKNMITNNDLFFFLESED